MAIAAKRFTVMALGFAEMERKILTGVFRLSESRNPGYGLLDGNEGILPDIFLVDADDAQAMRQLANLNPDGSTVTVFVGQAEGTGAQPTLSRPLQWMRLLKVLDAAIPKPSLVPPVARPVAVATPVEPVSHSVLVVDDSLPVRVFMKSKLEPVGLRVDYADSGEAALMMTDRKVYNAIFLDVIMGGMDGYQVCKQIKSKREHRNTTRVVMLTSKGSPFDKVRGAMAGCDAYLTKPVDESKLRGIISKFLSVPGGVESGAFGTLSNA